MMWSDNPTENQILNIFNSKYSFQVLRILMKENMTVPELSHKLGMNHYDRVYSAVKSLKKLGFIKIKSYKDNGDFKKIAVFGVTVKDITINISQDTTITVDTALVLHSEVFE